MLQLLQAIPEEAGDQGQDSQALGTVSEDIKDIHGLQAGGIQSMKKISALLDPHLRVH